MSTTWVEHQIAGAIDQGLDRQLRLEPGTRPTPDTTFANVERTMLDEHSWIDLVPGWLTGQQELFSQLATEAGWEHRERRIFNQVFSEPRFTAEYPDLSAAPNAALREIAEALSEHYGTVYDGVWMNFYRDHRDGAGWHADRPGQPTGHSRRAGAEPWRTTTVSDQAGQRRRKCRVRTAWRGSAGDGRPSTARLAPHGAEADETSGPAHQSQLQQPRPGRRGRLTSLPTMSGADVEATSPNRKGPMAKITVYTTGPSEACSRVQNVLDAREIAYDLVLVDTEPELAKLAERSGRRSCPLVYAGEELIGGLRETIDAERSGRLAQLIENGS